MSATSSVEAKRDQSRSRSRSRGRDRQPKDCKTRSSKSRSPAKPTVKDDTKSKPKKVDISVEWRATAIAFVRLITQECGVSMKIPGLNAKHSKWMNQLLSDYIGEPGTVALEAKYNTLDISRHMDDRADDLAPFIDFVDAHIAGLTGPLYSDRRDAWSITGIEAALAWCMDCKEIRIHCGVDFEDDVEDDVDDGSEADLPDHIKDNIERECKKCKAKFSEDEQKVQYTKTYDYVATNQCSYKDEYCFKCCGCQTHCDDCKQPYDHHCDGNWRCDDSDCKNKHLDCPTDAGPTDAGRTDAGRTDAGRTDAGPTEAKSGLADRHGSANDPAPVVAK